jgi:hypothetical protein
MLVNINSPGPSRLILSGHKAARKQTCCTETRYAFDEVASR